MAGTDEFAEQYANFLGLRRVCLTFDVDWAPEYMIRNVVRILTANDATATFFATHPSQILIDLTATGRFEIGTHPNLAPGSTQGKDLAEITGGLRRIYRHVVGNRFHLLDYSYRDLLALGRSGYLYDVSTLRMNCPYLLPAWHADVGLVLLTYCWEDGICENAGMPMRLESIELDRPGMKIVNFHPLNVYLNAPDAGPRLRMLEEHGDLLNCPQETADRYRCTGDGAQGVLVRLLEALRERGVQTGQLQDLAAAYKATVAEGGDD
jgi:hypothetical protein